MSGAGPRDPVRDRLAYPAAVAVIAMWIAAGIVGLWTGETQIFVLTTGLMTILFGYLFGRLIIRRAENGNGR